MGLVLDQRYMPTLVLGRVAGGSSLLAVLEALDRLAGRDTQTVGMMIARISQKGFLIFEQRNRISMAFWTTYFVGCIPKLDASTMGS